MCAGKAFHACVINIRFVVIFFLSSSLIGSHFSCFWSKLQQSLYASFSSNPQVQKKNRSVTWGTLYSAQTSGLNFWTFPMTNQSVFRKRKDPTIYFRIFETSVHGYFFAKFPEIRKFISC